MVVLTSRFANQEIEQSRLDPCKPGLQGLALLALIQGQGAIQGSGPAPQERPQRPGPPRAVVVGIGIGGLQRPHRADGKAGEPPRKRQ